MFPQKVVEAVTKGETVEGVFANPPLNTDGGIYGVVLHGKGVAIFGFPLKVPPVALEAKLKKTQRLHL